MGSRAFTLLPPVPAQPLRSTPPQKAADTHRKADVQMVTDVCTQPPFPSLFHPFPINHLSSCNHIPPSLRFIISLIKHLGIAIVCLNCHIMGLLYHKPVHLRKSFLPGHKAGTQSGRYDSVICPVSLLNYLARLQIPSATLLIRLMSLQIYLEILLDKRNFFWHNNMLQGIPRELNIYERKNAGKHVKIMINR